MVRRLSLPQRVLFIAACIWCGWLLNITFFMVVIGIGVVGILLREEEPLWAKFAFVFVLSFLAELKFTDFVLAASGVGVAAALGLSLGRRREAVALAAAFLGSWVFWWAAAGQHMDSILPYLSTSMEISRGYALAMGSDEGHAAFVIGLILAAAWGLFACDLAIRRGSGAHRRAAAAFIAIFAFVLWKYGFTRGDHTGSFFVVSFLMAIVLPPMLMPERRWHWFWIPALLGLAGFWNDERALFADSAGISIGRIRENARALAHAASLPEQWGHGLGRSAEAGHLPAIDKAVGSGSVDVFSYEQGAALVNGLNYAPRPVFQSYSAYTPRLEGLNLAFYRTQSAPAFVLWRQQPIDMRFPTIEDALLYPELARAYRVRLEEGGYVLLQREREVPPQPQRRVLMAERTVRIGDSIAVPGPSGTAVWLQADFSLNALGVMRSMAYKPPQMRMNVIDSTGKASTWRVLPEVAADGFLLIPFLESAPDFSDFMRGNGSKGIASVQFEAPGAQGRFWRPEVAVRFWSLPDLPMHPAE
jgi:hypothetical protein